MGGRWWEKEKNIKKTPKIPNEFFGNFQMPLDYSSGVYYNINTPKWWEMERMWCNVLENDPHIDQITQFEGQHQKG